MQNNPHPCYSRTSVRTYITAMKTRSRDFISNVTTELDSISLSENMVLPVTTNDHEYENSYVCSPYTALIPYCREELAKVGSAWVRVVIQEIIYCFDWVLKALRINKIYQINNWMLSTCLFPESLQKDEIRQSVKKATVTIPGHLLMYRSLNRHSNHKILEYFADLGFELLPTRQVYIFDKARKDYSQTHNYKIDKTLLEKAPYQYVTSSDISADDIPRIVELYNLLYIEKYSQHNPQFTSAFIEMIRHHPNFTLEVFRNREGVIDAVGGRFEMDGIVTLPIVGYDTGKPQKLGLYRLVMMSTLLYAETNRLVFNASSGASHFKMLRGAVPYIEYSAIYCRHLPFYRKVIWRLLIVLLNRLFVPIMKRYQL